MRSLRVLELLDKRKAGPDRSRIVVRFSMALVIPGLMVAPMLITLGTAKAQTSCRTPSSLAPIDILRSANALRQGDRVWTVAFVLNTSKHLQICDQDYYCPGNPDRYFFKPLISSNISDVTAGGSGPFDECRDVFSIVTVSGGSNSFTVGFKIKYQENVVPGGGTNPKSKTISLTYPGSVPVGGSMDFTDPSVTIQEFPDDGS